MATAAPATAASGTPTMAVSWVGDSFLGYVDINSTPVSAGDTAATAISIVVTGGTLTSLTAVTTWQRAIGRFAVPRSIQRGTTVWAADLGDSAPWSVTPTGPSDSTYSNVWTYRRTNVTGAVPLRITWADYVQQRMQTLLPATTVLTGTYATPTGTATVQRIVTMAYSSTTPFLTGTVS